jgi:hypothetical protein
MTFNFARRRPAAFFALLIGLSAAANARAADDETPVSVLIGDAVAEYEAGHYQEARALFRQAHDKSPTARTLRGIGMASFELRDYVEAVRALAASLRDQRRPLTAEQKRHAEALLARASTFVGRFTMKLKPAGASLFVDGRPAELEPENVLLLPFGRHQLSLRCASCSPAEKDEDIVVTGGERKDIELALATAPPTTASTPDTSGGAGGTALGGGPAGGTVTQPGGAGATTAERGTAHLWLAGLAGAAALGAGGTALWWREEEKEIDLCNQAEAPGAGGTCEGRQEVEDRRKLAIGATIGLGAVAVIGAAFAAILWSRPEKSESTTSNVACGIGKNSVSCAFRF